MTPYRGSWLDFEFDAKDLVNTRIDRKRKLPVTTLLYSLGMTPEEVLAHFYDTVELKKGKKGWTIPFNPARWRGVRPEFDVVNAKSGEIVFEKDVKITPRMTREKEKAKVTEILAPDADLVGRFAAVDMINEKTGEIYIEAGDEISEDHLEKFEEVKITQLTLLDIDHINVGAYMRNTVKADKAENRDGALAEIYKVMRI